MNITIDVVRNDFPRIGGKLGRHVEDTVAWAVMQTVAVAAPLTPVDTGALRANVSTQVSGESGTVTWGQEYAAYVEMGTYKMAPQPFAGPAVDQVGPQFVARLATLGI